MNENLRGGYVNETKFWARVDKTGDCWLWTGKARGGGYLHYGLVGVCIFGPRGHAWRLESVHRVSYELANGPIPKGLYVLHSCDQPMCVRPDHLRLGSHDDNMRDMAVRNRATRGSRVNTSRLSEADARAIKGLLREGVSASELGRRFGVTRQAIGLIKRGRNWAWLA